MRILILTAAAVAVALAFGCQQKPADAAQVRPVTAPPHLVADVPDFDPVTLDSLGIDLDRFRAGQAVFEQYCTGCHTYGPPPRLAPPMVGVSGHYHEAFADAEPAVAHMAAYVAAPAAERSKLLPMAVERWGLMAPLPLPEEERDAVAYWVWSLYELEGGMPAPMGTLPAAPRRSP